MSKMLIVIAGLMVSGATVVGAWSTRTDDCCSLGSGCCFTGSPCCGDSCQATAVSDKTEQPAEKKAVVTVIAVEDMECPTCAKKVVAKVNEVPGVAKSEADVKTQQLTVTAKDGATPSPKAMWEAIEKVGFKPTKLEGPGGTFTSKPKD